MREVAKRRNPLDFGCMMKTLRLSAGIGLRELSRSMDVSPTYLSLVEHGKQAPPNAARIAQIERALKVPAGCLSSLTGGLGADMAVFVDEVPESLDFLETARKSEMTSADFTDLTGFLSIYGWEAMRQALRRVQAADDAFGPEAPIRDAAGPFIWPFLRDGRIFDVTETSDKKGFLEDLVRRIAAHADGFDAVAVLAKLLEREMVTSTGIGGGVALPHAYMDGLDRMIVALARIPGGLDFDSIDGEPVHLAILLIGPRSAENMHLWLLARIAKLLSYKRFRNRLLTASGPGEIIAIFREAESGIP